MGRYIKCIYPIIKDYLGVYLFKSSLQIIYVAYFCLSNIKLLEMSCF